MSLFDSASLVVTPNGYKATKLYSVIPTDGTGDMTFARAGNTATRVNASGLIEAVNANIPRLDYTGGGCPKLLLEPQRTNLWIDSSNFSGGTLSYSSFTANTTETLDPMGTNFADKFLVTASGQDSHMRIQKFIAVQNATASFYLKGAVGQKFQFFIARDSFQELTTQNFTCDGTWQRVVLNKNFSTTSTTMEFGFEFGYTSSDSINGQIYYLFGIQVESGSYATSYIPTTTAAVTRNADSCYKTSATALIGQTEGTIYWNVDVPNVDSSNDIRILLYNSDRSQIILFGFNSSNIRILLYNGSSITDNYVATTSGQKKLALGYKSGNYALYNNGVSIWTSSTNILPTTSEIYIQNDYNIANVSISKTQAIAFWKTRLSNADLAALTSL